MPRRFFFFQAAPTKFKLFNLLNFLTERSVSSAGLTVSELRTQLRGEYLEALNVMLCNKGLFLQIVE